MTSDSQMQSSCITKTIAGNWLSNGHLEICLLKLIAPTENQWKNDESRTENIEIVKKLLQPFNGSEKSLLEIEIPSKPAFVLATELAFGSSDYETLNMLITQYRQNLIFIGGFGFTKGDALTNLAVNANVEGVWNTPPNASKKYNGGWVWVKKDDNIQRYILLKNFPEQTHELSIPNLVFGDSILRLEGDDLVIFPLICADLISAESSSPRKRIIASLSNDSSTNKKTLIAGALLNHKSSSDWWKTAIGDLLESTKASNPRLLLSNCLNPSPLQAEEEDKWRCLSGGYQYLEGSKPPKISLPYLRYVADTKFSGLVVRNSYVGCVFAKLNWSNNPAEGRNIFSPGSQCIWNNEELQLCDGESAADELCRFIQRNKGKVFDGLVNFNDNARTLADGELDKLLIKLSPNSSSPLRKVAGLLFLKCLKGINTNEAFSPDTLHTKESSLDCAITTLVLIQNVIDAELMPEGKELDHGQLLSSDGEHEVLVWDSSEHTANQLYNMVAETLVKDGGSARPLTIIGRGNGGGTMPPDGRVNSTRLADITNASSAPNLAQSADRDICEANDRVVFWKNQGAIDEILSSNNPGQNLADDLKSQISFTEAS